MSFMRKRNIRSTNGENAGRGGFTLIELMIVIVILGILSTMVVLNIAGAPDEARVTKARTDIQTIESALTLYKVQNGFYPSTEQGLKALVEKPSTKPVPRNYPRGGYLKQDNIPLDPWGNPTSTGVRAKGTIPTRSSATGPTAPRAARTSTRTSSAGSPTSSPGNRLSCETTRAPTA